ncbi:MAG: extracellular solute-binding protein [Oscillibacter sp.]|nr:extracellular solute-binding protein [Oscillibacter sp.]
MKKRAVYGPRRWAAVLLSVAAALTLASCEGHEDPKNLIPQVEEAKTVVNLFSPMEKIDPDAENVARTASDLTVAMAEHALGVTVDYNTYTAENYQDKTYDEVSLDRARNNMDDLYLLNPDTILTLGKEGKLMDLSGLDSAKNLRQVVRTANTVDGKLIAIPQEVVAYGLFVNKDLFDRYGLRLPQTPEEFLECCRVLKENGIETPVGANRWWLETFVFAQAYAELYNGENAEAEIAALNSGEARYSDYMRPGFEFLQTLIDRGYIDAEKAAVSEAIEAEGPDFLAGKTPIVMAYWGAANTETAYGKTDFEMQVIGFPSALGQMPVIPMTGLAVCVDAEHAEDAAQVLNIMVSDEALQIYSDNNRVISPSKNVKVDCVPALKPLNDRIEAGVYVLGSNAGMNVEQWGNTCLIVRELLNGATVDQCMAAFDELQDAALNAAA